MILNPTYYKSGLFEPPSSNGQALSQMIINTKIDSNSNEK